MHTNSFNCSREVVDMIDRCAHVLTKTNPLLLIHMHIYITACMGEHFLSTIMVLLHVYIYISISICMHAHMCLKIDKLARMHMQVSFIDFVLMPFWHGVVEIIPELQPCIDNLNSNRRFYQRVLEVRAYVCMCVCMQCICRWFNSRACCDLRYTVEQWMPDRSPCMLSMNTRICACICMIYIYNTSIYIYIYVCMYLYVNMYMHAYKYIMHMHASIHVACTNTIRESMHACRATTSSRKRRKRHPTAPTSVPPFPTRLSRRRQKSTPLLHRSAGATHQVWRRRRLLYPWAPSPSSPIYIYKYILMYIYRSVHCIYIRACICACMLV